MIIFFFREKKIIWIHALTYAKTNCKRSRKLINKFIKDWTLKKVYIPMKISTNHINQLKSSKRDYHNLKFHKEVVCQDNHQEAAWETANRWGEFTSKRIKNSQSPLKLKIFIKPKPKTSISLKYYLRKTWMQGVVKQFPKKTRNYSKTIAKEKTKLTSGRSKFQPGCQSKVQKR